VSLDEYAEFLARKAPSAPLRGLKEVPKLAGHLFDFQAGVTGFGLEVGSWGLFLDTGLGKTACELEWCRHAAEASNGKALILTPLAVASQIVREGQRWGYDIRQIREQSEAREGINVCNFDRLHLLDPEGFGAVAADESSILKNFTGATSRTLRRMFATYRWRMAASATPAPNDYMELGQSCEFLGVMPSNEMLMRFFTSDQTEMGRYRIKGHAELAFWDWMASWSRMASHPADLGSQMGGYDLPRLNVVRHRVETGAVYPGGTLFASGALAATEVHNLKRQTSEGRAALIHDLVQAEPGEPWVIWCDTDYEADAVMKRLRPFLGASCAEVRGSQKPDLKERSLEAFALGEIRVLVTKPKIAAYGLNWQRCARTAFVGRSHSYELWYQAVRRFWRFGQPREVIAHLAIAEGEDAIGRVIDRKAEEHERMKRQMVDAMERDARRRETLRAVYTPTLEGHLPAWLRCA
jgi:hypothetical protein